MALPTKGRIILETTVGEIDIELWFKVRVLRPPAVHPFLQETPQNAGTSYLALAMEGASRLDGMQPSID